MTKKLKPEERKGIIVTNDAAMHIYGGVRGPITSKYYETVEKIGSMLADKAKVTQVTSKGEKIELDFTNFDKDLDPYDEEVDEILELITCTPDKIIDLEITKTVTIGTDVEACSFESLNTQIATVTPDGLVTGIKDGETAIRVSKEGYRTVSIPVTVIEQQSVTCMPPQISGLVVGQTIKITATPAEATFKSESDLIATVTPEGVVEAISQGETKIIVSADGYKAAEVVVSTKNKPVIKCTPNAIDGLYVGDTTTIETEPTGVGFRSENDEYATVTENGVVEGVKAGTTNIIVSKEGYQDAKVSVTLKDKLDIDVNPTAIETLYVEEEIKLTTDPNVVNFKSENDLYATVTDKGVVRGVKVGSTNIIITKEGYKELKVPVNVKEKETIQCTPKTIDELQVGLQQTITTEPVGATFQSESNEIATVTPEGVVEGVGQGSTNIIVTKDGYNQATVPVTVIPRKIVTCEPTSIVDLTVGQTQTITATPSNATFRVEEEGVISVTPEGLVEALTEGQGKVIVEAEGYEAAVVVVTTKNPEA